MQSADRAAAGSAPRKLAAALVALGFFWILYLRHYSATGVPEGFHPTGFIQHDQSYYSANGREIFERGNGFAYPNPFDPAPDAPVIYFHWFAWLLGFGIKKLGLEPGGLYVAIGAVASIVFAWLTFRLVEAVLPDRRHVTLLFFFAMWAGGALCLARVIANLLGHRGVADDLVAYDPNRGWWFLYWGRNVLYPSEATYHVIVAAAWLALIRERWRLSLVLAVLLASTHPFSGLELLLTVFAWLGFLAISRRSLPVFRYWLATVILLLLFAGYYFVFLPSFPQHRALVHTWGAVQYGQPGLTALLAYGPIGVLAAWRLWIDRGNLGSSVFFFVTCFVVAFALTEHDWIISSHQPLHFTHGYVWMPLCLIAMPLLQRMIARTRVTLGAVGFALIIVLPAATLAVADNAAFVTDAWRAGGGPLYLRTSEREMLDWMERENLDGVLLTPNGLVSYLAATYTSVRPFYGHPYNTPDNDLRRELGNAYLRTCTAGPWLASIDYVLLHRQAPSPCMAGREWTVAHTNEDLILYRRLSSR